MTKNIVTTIMLSVLIPLLPFNSLAQENKIVKPLTLEESIDAALKDNRGLRAASYRVKGAKEKVKEAITYYLPSFKLESTYTRLNEDPTLDMEAGVLGPQPLSVPMGDSDIYEVSGIIQQPLFTGGKLTALNRQAKSNLKSIENGYNQTENELILHVKNAYFGILLSEKFMDVSVVSVEQLMVHLDTVEKLFKAGTVPNIDVLRTEVQLANAEQVLIKAENNLEVVKSVFNTILCRDINTPVKVVDILEHVPVEVNLNQVIQEALIMRPEIKVIAAKVEMAQEAVKIIQSRYWPQLAAFGKYRHHKGDKPIIEWEDDWAVGVMGTVDVWNWGQTHFQIAQAKAVLREAQELEIQLKDGVALEVKIAYLYLKETQKMIGVAQKAVKQAQQSLRSTEIGYKAGRVDNVEVLAAQLASTQAQTNYLGALYGYMIAKAELEKAIGKKESDFYE